MTSADRLGANQSTRRRAWRARSCVFYFARRDRGILFFQISLVHHCVRGGGGGTECSMFNGECGIIRTSSEQRLRTVYLVRGAGWSPWFVEPHTRDRPKKPDEPDPRHAPRSGPGSILVFCGVLGCRHAAYHWKVLGGTIKVNAKSLSEGAIVTVLAPEGDETFELLPKEEAKLLAAIAEAERGETTSASHVLEQIRRS